MKIKGEDLHFKELLGEKNAELTGNFSGNIIGEKDKFNGELNIESISGKYFGVLKDLSGKLIFSKEKNLFLEFNGEIGKVSYDDYELNGLNLVARLKDNIFEIKNFNNQLLDISGNINLNNETINLNTKIQDLSLKKFKIEKPEIRINDVIGKIEGKLSNPKGKLFLNDIEIILENNEKIGVNLELG